MNKNKINGHCEYNKNYHGIIACGRDIDEGMELYDINKDKWIFVKKRLPMMVHDMFLARDHPDIVYILGNKYGGSVYQIDMRDRNTPCVPIVCDENVDSCDHIRFIHL